MGPRTFHDYDRLKRELDRLPFRPTLIVSGGADGADTLAERYADEHGIEKLIHEADWLADPVNAGFLRNPDIVRDSDAVIAFWNGTSNGTRDTIRLSRIAKKLHSIVLYKEPEGFDI